MFPGVAAARRASEAISVAALNLKHAMEMSFS
jgi:hypothetical protein